jgi:purine-binding chemotaxis protein CheW
MNLLLPFQLGEETYALEVTDVQEVVESQPIYPLPGAPHAIVGAISFHGRIVPVVDLPLLLGFAAGARAERLIVLTDSYGPLALRVDQLRRIVAADLVNGTLSQSESEQNCISATINWQNEMINLLSLEQLQRMLEARCSRTGG